MAFASSVYAHTLNGLKWAWQWTQNLVGWIGLAIALLTFYLQTSGKEHDLNIVVSSVDPGGDRITFGVIYSNTGDYTEIITGASASLLENTDSNMAWSDVMEDCFAPIVVKPGDAIHKFYTVRLPYYGFKRVLNEGGKIESHLEISHNVLMPNGGSQRFELMVGKVAHRAAGDAFSSIDIENNVLKVNFEDSPVGLGSTTLPDGLTSPRCIKKRRHTSG